MKKCYIYMLTNTNNGKRYIGSSINPKRRFIQHKSDYKYRKLGNPMYKDMEKGDKFKMDIIYETTIENRYIDETRFQKELNPEYNINYATYSEEKHKEWTEANKEKSNEYSKNYKRKYRKERKWQSDSLEYRRQHYDAINEKRREKRNKKCLYNGEVMTVGALEHRLQRSGFKKYASIINKAVEDYNRR